MIQGYIVVKIVLLGESYSIRLINGRPILYLVWIKINRCVNWKELKNTQYLNGLDNMTRDIIGCLKL